MTSLDPGKLPRYELYLECDQEDLEHLVSIIKRDGPGIKYIGYQEFFPATEEEVARARDLYCDSSCDLEVDADAGTSPADYGTWVQAWVWLPYPDPEVAEAACP